MINKHEVTYFGNQDMYSLEKTFKVVNLKEW